MKVINSKVFGKTTLLEDGDNHLLLLRSLTNSYPVNSFGILNKMLNEKGLCISVGVIGEVKNE